MRKANETPALGDLSQGGKYTHPHFTYSRLKKRLHCGIGDTLSATDFL